MDVFGATNEGGVILGNISICFEKHCNLGHTENILSASLCEKSNVLTIGLWWIGSMKKVCSDVFINLLQTGHFKIFSIFWIVTLGTNSYIITVVFATNYDFYIDLSL